MREELEEMVEQSFLLVQVQKMALLMAQALEPESWVLEFVKKEQELPVAKKKRNTKTTTAASVKQGFSNNNCRE